MWYHDHTVGETRLNVYFGVVSAYFLTDDLETKLMDDISLPIKDYTIPLIIQEKAFVPDDDLLQWQDSNGNVLARVINNGQFGVAGRLSIGNGGAGFSTTALAASAVGTGNQGQVRVVGLGREAAYPAGNTNQWGDAYTIVQVQIANNAFLAPAVAI